MAKPRRKEKAAPDETGWEENRKPKRPRRRRLNGYQIRCTDRRCSLHEVWRQMARGIGGAHRSKPRPPRSSISKTKAQPTGMRTTCSAPTRMAAGRVSASNMSARGVATPTAVLRLSRCEQTHCGQQNLNYARRPRKEGNSFGHGLPHPRESTFSLLQFACPSSRTPDLFFPSWLLLVIAT